MDHTSAAVFSIVFEALSEHKGEVWVKQLACDLFKMTKFYNFSFEQMDCDSALVQLGLATRGLGVVTYREVK